MLFRKNIEPHCIYCKHAKKAGADTMICRYKGICSEAGHCRRFRYDPLRRTPPRAKVPDFSKYSSDDFSL